MNPYTHAPTIAIDLDGTLIENQWPEIGPWLPGAIEAMKKIHNAGIEIVLHSCRLSPYTQEGTERDLIDVYRETNQVRELLDDAGLGFIDIHHGMGKPSADLYVDDKAWIFTGVWKREDDYYGYTEADYILFNLEVR